MDQNSTILQLIQEAFAEFDKPDLKVSKAIRKAIRIARLRNDFDNLYWLEFEMIDVRDEMSKNRIWSEIMPHYSSDDFEGLKQYGGETLLEARSLQQKKKVMAWGISEIENHLDYIHHIIDGFTDESHKHELRQQILELSNILKKVEHRVYQFLSYTEKQILSGQKYSDIFERNRQYVDIKLSECSPEALEQLVIAYQRLNEGNEEARSQALLSCRRTLKTLADTLYPPSQHPIVGPDRKQRKLSDDKYINRLWQFVAEKLKGSASGDLLLYNITDLGGRIDRVYELSSKGVHAHVAEFEANQCVIQTYLVLGDILRLNDQESALLSEDN